MWVSSLLVSVQVFVCVGVVFVGVCAGVRLCGCPSLWVSIFVGVHRHLVCLSVLCPPIRAPVCVRLFGCQSLGNRLVGCPLV